MSVQTSAAVWRGSSHDGSTLLMLLAIADFADDNGRAYPSVATLARKCRMQPRNCNYVLLALQASGELSIKRGAGPHGTNLYRVMLDRLQGVQASAGVQAAAPLQPTAGVQPRAGLQRIAGGAASHCAVPLQPVAPKPSLNHQEPPKAKARRVSGAYSESFNAIWSLYPNRANKSAASKAFAKLNPGPDLVAIIRAAVATQRTWPAWTKDAGAYVPHLATWLNNRRWEDEAPAGASPLQPAPGAAGWRDSTAGIRAKGQALGLGDWDQDAFDIGRGEHWTAYKARVLRAAESEVHA